jgi:hypothetical protein
MSQDVNALQTEPHDDWDTFVPLSAAAVSGPWIVQGETIPYAEIQRAEAILAECGLAAAISPGILAYMCRRLNKAADV